MSNANNSNTVTSKKAVILVTGASSGFGRLTAEALAKAGHTVYASMRDIAGRNAAECRRDGRDLGTRRRRSAHGRTRRAVRSHPPTPPSADHRRDRPHRRRRPQCRPHDVRPGRESFTPEQFAQLYDVNVLGTQRVNRAALPHMRKQKQGLLVWVSSSSSAGGTPPYLSPYFAAKAAMDALAVQYARELARWGIETSIIVPGAFTKGTNHFAHSGRPADEARLAEYEAVLTRVSARRCRKAFAAIVPADADVAGVAEAIVDIVEHALRQAAVPRPLRPDPGRRRCRLHRARPPARRNAAPCRPG